MEPIDDANHIIIEFSIHDAVDVGFKHVVHIIHKDIEKEFKEVNGTYILYICTSHNGTMDFTFQNINFIPGKLKVVRY